MRYLAWLRKEWRDHRAILIGIFLAVPGLTGLAYSVFGERIGAARLENVRAIFLAIGVGLVVFAVAADMIAGENRRGTIRAVRRLPGGLAHALAAKGTLLALVLVAVIGLQGLSLAVAEALNGPVMEEIGLSNYHHNGATRSMALLSEFAAFPTSTLWLTGSGYAVVALWTLLVSSWMGRSGVAGIGALVLLAALGTPFVLFFRDHPWFFPGPLRLASLAAMTCAAVGVLATAVSFLVGQRYAGRPFRPFAWGLLVVLLACGGGYAYAQRAVGDWLTFGPETEDLRIHDAYVGAGGRYLYVNVSRGAAWSDGRVVGHANHNENDPWGSRRGTPLQAWTVDLETGTYEPVDGRAMRYFMHVPEAWSSLRGHHLEPVEALTCYRLEESADAQLGLAWWNARTASEVRVLPSGVRDASTLDLVRAQLTVETDVRAADGRRLWNRDGVLEREGEAFERPTGVVARVPKTAWHQPIPGGWFGFRHIDGTMQFVVLDAATGAEHEIEKAPATAGYAAATMLSPEHALVPRAITKGTALPPGVSPCAIVWVRDGGRIEDVRNVPDVVLPVFARDEALALRGPQGDRQLELWNPWTGATRRPTWIGRAVGALDQVLVLGRTGDGRTLLQLGRNRAGSAYAVLDAHGETARVLLPMEPRAEVGVIALMPDNALVLRVGYGRIVRFEPDGRETQLFPRK